VPTQTLVYRKKLGEIEFMFRSVANLSNPMFSFLQRLSFPRSPFHLPRASFALSRTPSVLPQPSYAIRRLSFAPHGSRLAIKPFRLLPFKRFYSTMRDDKDDHLELKPEIPKEDLTTIGGNSDALANLIDSQKKSSMRCLY